MTEPDSSQPGSAQTPGSSPKGDARLDGAALDRLRPLAFTVAYRMLGSVTEAEDVVQEALVRLSQAEGVRNPDAFVTTVTTRIAIDVLRSARVRRESYVGEWLPEPLVGPVQSTLPVAMSAPPADAAAHAELADDLSTAFLVLLETLTPAERAAFLLHDVLGFPHADAADVIGTSEVAARQLASRARRRIAGRRDSSGGGRAERARADELVTRFLAACEEGAVDSFLELLAEDVVLSGDSGGNVPRGMSLARPVAGRVTVARMLASFMRRGGPFRFERALVGGEPGLLIMADEALGGGLIGTWAFEVSDGRLAAIRGVINPEKLWHLAPLADLDRIQAWLKGPGRRTAR
ncbi:RNA polymerase sigma-70 factor [Promicromonospora xylanilytica]